MVRKMNVNISKIKELEELLKTHKQKATTRIWTGKGVSRNPSAFYIYMEQC
jgi:hypothetical protein